MFYARHVLKARFVADAPNSSPTLIYLRRPPKEGNYQFILPWEWTAWLANGWHGNWTQVARVRRLNQLRCWISVLMSWWWRYWWYWYDLMLMIPSWVRCKVKLYGGQSKDCMQLGSRAISSACNDHYRLRLLYSGVVTNTQTKIISEFWVFK